MLIKISDRLAEYLNFKKISYNAFDKKLGLSNGYIGKQIRNKASIGGDIIEKISCTYEDISMEWLIRGEGEMLKGIEIKNKPNTNEAPLLLKRVEELVWENGKLKEENKKLRRKKNYTPPTTERNITAKSKLTQKK